MTTSLILPTWRSYFKGKFTFLFLSFILLFLVLPFLGEGPVLLEFLFTLLLLSSIRAVAEKRITWIIALCLVVPDILLTWGVYFITDDVSRELALSEITLYRVNIIWRTVFLTFVASHILYHIMKVPKVTADTIFGSFCVYFLMALIWAQIYSITVSFVPHSFAFPNMTEDLHQWQNIIGTVGPNFLYYSIVTLTTLGYGDITPVSLPAKYFAAFEALVGQLYLTVLVARLVGLHISGQRAKRQE